MAVSGAFFATPEFKSLRLSLQQSEESYNRALAVPQRSFSMHLFANGWSNGVGYGLIPLFERVVGYERGKETWI